MLSAQANIGIRRECAAVPCALCALAHPSAVRLPRARRDARADGGRARWCCGGSCRLDAEAAAAAAAAAAAEGGGGVDGGGRGQCAKNKGRQVVRGDRVLGVR